MKNEWMDFCEDLQGRAAWNICLFYGKDDLGTVHLPKLGDGDCARLGDVEWNDGYPVIMAGLWPTGGKAYAWSRNSWKSTQLVMLASKRTKRRRP